MKIQFVKYQGTGNDFILIDNRSGAYSNITEQQVNHMCNRHKGIGADGVMLLNNLADYDFEMKYFNADGKESSMCGNGGRCIVKYARSVGIIKDIYHFLAPDGEHVAEIDNDDRVRLKMKDIDLVENHSNYFFVDTGSPHFVKYVDDLNYYDVYHKGREIRNSSKFQEKGVNVNFVESLGPDEIYVRTYERGVENETLSCGTGVTASAVVSAHNDNGFNLVEVRTQGGKLIVEFDKLDENHFENIWLCGPAEFVFTGTIII